MILATYFEFREKFITDARDNGQNQQTLYDFLEHLMMTDFQRLQDRSAKLKSGSFFGGQDNQVIGNVKYDESFPALGASKKGKQTHNRFENVWSDQNQGVAFTTNHKHEV